MVQGCIVMQSKAILYSAAPEEDSPPYAMPAKLYQQIYIYLLFFFFFIANQKQPKLQSRVQVGLSGELASFTSLFAGLKIYMLKLGVFFFFFLILGLRRRL